MDIDHFWNIVDRVHAASGGDMDAKCRLLADELANSLQRKCNRLANTLLTASIKQTLGTSLEGHT
jgi:hypothetical protein